MIGTSGSRVLDFFGRIILGPYILFDHLRQKLRRSPALDPAELYKSDPHHEWGMSPHFEEVYLDAELRLRRGWIDLVDEFRLSGWESPWINNQYRDGNPIFSAALTRERKHVIVLMHPLGTVGTNGSDTSQLTIYSGVRKEDVQDALLILRQWIQQEEEGIEA